MCHKGCISSKYLPKIVIVCFFLYLPCVSVNERKKHTFPKLDKLNYKLMTKKDPTTGPENSIVCTPTEPATQNCEVVLHWWQWEILTQGRQRQRNLSNSTRQNENNSCLSKQFLCCLHLSKTCRNTTSRSYQKGENTPGFLRTYLESFSGVSCELQKQQWLLHWIKFQIFPELFE